jgi:DNA-directed RNA polymerase subunit omega
MSRMTSRRKKARAFGTGAGDLLAEMQQAQISDDEAEEADMAIDGEFEDAAEADDGN